MGESPEKSFFFFFNLCMRDPSIGCEAAFCLLPRAYTFFISTIGSRWWKYGVAECSAEGDSNHWSLGGLFLSLYQGSIPFSMGMFEGKAHSA